MIGRDLGRYRILEEIGSGGMGVVYLAHDRRLDRDVALKVLPIGKLNDETARQRFRLEALALSRLNHPAIAIVHDFDHQDGIDFLVSEFIPGDTLEDRLHAGPLSEQEIADYGAQLLSGLAAAHEKGVIHRDLKPGNVKITPDGRVKILDFGIAKLLGTAKGSEPTMLLTGEGMVTGTIPYMSPEQLRGATADARSDLYSVGVVLYELATGRRPFADPVVPRLIDSILHAEPDAPRAKRPELSLVLESVILKALRKDPSERFGDARGMKSALEGLVPVPRHRVAQQASGFNQWLVVGIAVVAVAAAAFLVRSFLPSLGETKTARLLVLPFQNLSADPDQEFFSDGLTDEMISQLGDVSPERLGVLGRTTSMRFKDRKKGVKEIRKELGVDYILDGSVRRAADRVRITAGLVKAKDGDQVWTKRYDGTVSDVFRMQSEVAHSIAEALAIRLAPAKVQALERTPTSNAEAHLAYLRGRHAWNRRDEEGLRRAVGYFQEALTLDPSYAAAHVGLADSYLLLANYGYVPPNEAMPLAKTSAARALRLDDALGEAHASLASVLQDYEWKWSDAEREYRRAIALRPQYATAHQWYADFLLAMGRPKEALIEIEKARALEPDSVSAALDYASYFYLLGQLDRALVEYRRAAALDTTSSRTYGLLATAAFEAGRPDEAVGALERQWVLAGYDPAEAAGLAQGYRTSGLAGLRRAQLDDLLERAKTQYVPPYEIGALYASLGERDRAFEWLDKAFAERSSKLVGLNIDRMLAGIRSDPRFQDLLRRVGLFAVRA